jgi:hypothetical protein
MSCPHSSFRGWDAGRGNGRSGVHFLGLFFRDLGIFNFFFFSWGRSQRSLTLAKQRTTRDAPGNQPMVAGLCRRSTVGTCSIISLEGQSSWSKIAPSTHDHVGSVGASPTSPTSNGQPDVEDFKSGSMGEGLRAPSEPG